MKIYLAARYSRREELCGYRTQLEALGHVVTSRWLNGNHQVDDRGLSVEGAQTERVRFATEDRDDVLSAEVLIAFTEAPRSSNSRGGRHVELGIALGTRSMAVIVVGPRENVFCCLPEVLVLERFDECLPLLSFQPMRIKISEYQHAVTSGGHSNHHLVACPACGDIDGCHLPAGAQNES